MNYTLVKATFGPMPVWVAPITIKRRPLIADIQAAVAHHYELPLIEMRSARRSRAVAWPRQVAMYLAKRLTPQSLPEIGRRFGRDHTTVIHAIKAVTERRLHSVELDADILAIEEMLA